MEMGDRRKTVSEVEAKGPGYTEGSCFRVFQVIPPEIEIESEDLKDIAYPQGVLPVDLIGRGIQGDVGRTVQGDVLI